jgi:hypothetical protein
VKYVAKFAWFTELNISYTALQQNGGKIV